MQLASNIMPTHEGKQTPVTIVTHSIAFSVANSVVT